MTKRHIVAINDFTFRLHTAAQNVQILHVKKICTSRAANREHGQCSSCIVLTEPTENIEYWLQITESRSCFICDDRPKDYYRIAPTLYQEIVGLKTITCGFRYGSEYGGIH